MPVMLVWKRSETNGGSEGCISETAARTNVSENAYFSVVQFGERHARAWKSADILRGAYTGSER